MKCRRFSPKIKKIRLRVEGQGANAYIPPVLLRRPAHIVPVRVAIALLIAVVLPAHPFAAAQGSAGSDAKIEPRSLIDVPTAGMLRSSMKSFEVDFFHDDGLQAAFLYGITDRLMIGFSYGGLRMIGAESPEWNDIPGVVAKLRILEESVAFPALVLGFDSQGKEGYVDDRDRFRIKSPGLYVVFSKNYNASGFLGFHGGVNYSFERSDGDRDPSIFFGIDKSLGSFLSLEAEYNAAWNDNGSGTFGRGRGYLNAAIAASPGAGITISFQFKDLLENQPHSGFANRTLSIEFTK